jgi:large subunit ribosomal protein L17
MRHRKKGRKFGRVRKVRKALSKSLLRALIDKERITTTEAKAKEIRPEMEKLISKSKIGTLAVRKVVINKTDAKSAIKLFSKIAPRFQSRKGGYTRIIKAPTRKSDNARMAIIELVK